MFENAYLRAEGVMGKNCFGHLTRKNQFFVSYGFLFAIEFDLGTASIGFACYCLAMVGIRVIKTDDRASHY